MSITLDEFLRIDLMPMLAAVLASASCAALGSFLLLRRLSLMGDAISHSVLPGLVGAFLLLGSRGTFPMMLGAMAAGVATVLLVELIGRHGRVESGAAMGVVFTVLFALGVVMIERAGGPEAEGARGVDLDPACVLYGNLEAISWFRPQDSGWLSRGALLALPRQAVTLAATAAGVGLFIIAFFKELRIASFDPGLATSLGFGAQRMHVLLMSVIAAVVVASFEAVGSILVIAMLVCPPAAARMLTDRLSTQVWLGAAIGAACGIAGYLAAAFGPGLFGATWSLSASGMMAVVAGGFLGLAIVAGPRHGLAARRLSRLRIALGVLREDALAMLYRLEEFRGAGARMEWAAAARALGGGATARLALRAASRGGEVERTAAGVGLTSAGRARARSLVRTHRLWETYLVRELGLRADHVHRPAESLEHITDRAMRERLAAAAGAAADPHDRPIPPEGP